METEIRRLHPLSWLFITAISVKGLIVPLVIVLFASSANPLARFELLGVLIVVPALVSALLKQGVYNYRFTDEELVIREGILTRKERHIPYERVHNVALVRNPFHRALGVASARIETAAGGEPEAVMRGLTLEAVDELRRFMLGTSRPTESTDLVELKPLGGDEATGAANDTTAGVEAAGAANDTAAGVEAPARLPERAAMTTSGATPSALLNVPPRELVRLGLISNRGLIVVAAFFGVLSQVNWWDWDLDWEAYLETAREGAPSWTTWLLAPGSAGQRALLGLGLVVLFIIVLRVFSIGWYLVKYYGFTLERGDEGLRTEFGLFTRVSSVIPVHRIQLLTTNASLLHRWLGRTGIDVETGSEIGRAHV